LFVHNKRKQQDKLSKQLSKKLAMETVCKMFTSTDAVDENWKIIDYQIPIQTPTHSYWEMKRYAHEKT
jgi:hypothetical protein